MQKFTLESFFQIIGIGAASGLVYKDNILYIISDSSGFLYEYDMVSTALKKINLGNTEENIPKKDKPDFEAITHFNNNLYIFGSGSTKKRNRMIQIDSNKKEIVAINDLTEFYSNLQNSANIKPKDFNIEGVIFTGENWYFFNRGNGKNIKNVVFNIQGKNLNDDSEIHFTDYKLPEINGVTTSFTDAILVDDKIYFLATAEDSDSTFNDGEVMGSIVGSINIQTMQIEFTQQITDSKKLEGLTLYKNSADEIEFLLCEDNDSEEMKTNIYHLLLDK